MDCVTDWTLAAHSLWARTTTVSRGIYFTLLIDKALRRPGDAAGRARMRGKRNAPSSQSGPDLPVAWLAAAAFNSQVPAPVGQYVPF